MIRGALEADGRLAAKNAVKIRAALHQVTDFKRVFNKYQETMPQPTDNPTQDRVRARSWLILNVYLNDEPLRQTVMRAWAEAYVLGQAAADEWIKKTKEANKADDIEVNWDNWKPGDKATALLLNPTKGFEAYLQSTGGASYFKKFNKETVINLGTALSDSIELGLGAESAAVMIGRHVGSPARALTIAITEQNRAMSFSTIERYKEAGLAKMEWAVSDPCDICAKNDGQVIVIGQTFASGDAQPPAHPHCRCVLLPVIPGMEEETTMAEGTPMPSTSGNVQDYTLPATVQTMPYPWNPKLKYTDPKDFLKDENYKIQAKDLQAAAAASLSMRMSRDTLKTIIKDKKFKSLDQVETNFGGRFKIAETYRQNRKSLENGTWGIPENTQQPIYGYMDQKVTIHRTTGNTFQEPSVAGYGDIQIILKDEIKNRTTITLGDSLNTKRTPVEINQALTGDLSNAQVSSAVDIGAYDYYEAQIHGGLSITDIKEIRLNGQTVSKAEKQALLENGIIINE
jgi:SPP1 gp7 family putative phage head morphogenesis protein